MASETARLVDLEAVAAFAAGLARTLRPGDVVALHGELGAGKTTLARGIVAALHGGAGAVSSPTFVFRHRYPGSPPVEHLDLYRIETPDDAAELGLEEAFDPGSVTLVEWPDRLPGLVPPGAIHIWIEGAGEQPRIVRVAR